MHDNILCEDEENNSFLNNTNEECDDFVVTSINQASCTHHLLDNNSLCFKRKVEVSSGSFDNYQVIGNKTFRIEIFKFSNTKIYCFFSFQNKWFSFYKLFKYAGPGLLISVAYLDPGNLESDLRVGSLTNYKVIPAPQLSYKLFIHNCFKSKLASMGFVIQCNRRIFPSVFIC